MAALKTHNIHLKIYTKTFRVKFILKHSGSVITGKFILTGKFRGKFILKQENLGENLYLFGCKCLLFPCLH